MGLFDLFKKPTVAQLEARGDVNRLVQMLLAKDGTNAMEAASALARMGGEKGVAGILTAILSPNLNVRAAGALALAMVSDPNALPILTKMITDKSLPEPVRTMAVHSVGGMKCREGLAPLVELLDAPQTGLKTAAAYALGTLGIRDERATEALLRQCRDPKWDCRHAATAALATLGDPRALEFVKKLLDEESDPGSRVELIRALGDLGGPEATAILTALQAGPKDRGLGSEIATALSRCRT